MSTFQIYYTRSDRFAEFIFGDRLPIVAELATTHTFIRTVEIDVCNLEAVYHQCQGEVWSPNGEARDLIERSGAGHTSMAIGDVVECGGRFWAVAPVGFVQIGGEG